MFSVRFICLLNIDARLVYASLSDNVYILINVADLPNDLSKSTLHLLSVSDPENGAKGFRGIVGKGSGKSADGVSIGTEIVNDNDIVLLFSIRYYLI